MRITFVCPKAGLSGGTRVIAIYADRLTRRGHDVTVVSLPPRRATLRERVRSFVRRRPLPAEMRHGPSHLDGLAIRHHRLEENRPVVASDLPDADVVIATWWETAEWVARLPESKGAKAYFVQHHEVFTGQPSDRVEATYRLPLHKICVAQWLIDLCRERGDASAILVPNSVDLEQFAVPPRGKQSVPTVGLMYSPAGFKGCDVSLAAFDAAKRDVPNLRLVAFGSAPANDKLPLPPDAQFTLRPAQDRIRDIYAAADAWLFGSRSEGFGLPILEAMACRTPVIGTPAGAAPELLAQGGGIQVPMDDPRAMADAIRTICAMPDPEWRRLSDAAHATTQQYTWDDATDRFEAALKRVAEITVPAPSGTRS